MYDRRQATERGTCFPTPEAVAAGSGAVLRCQPALKEEAASSAFLSSSGILHIDSR